jgi:hypothetical protein
MRPGRALLPVSVAAVPLWRSATSEGGASHPADVAAAEGRRLAWSPLEPTAQRPP